MDEKEELTLEQIQEKSFEILKKIKKIFDENGWKYYITYGTLIGTIRNHGFIPWDDDIDIWVPRPDYEKFVKYCIENKEKIKPYELMHYLTNDKYIYPIARMSDSRYSINYNLAKEYGLGIFIDIYPIDGVNPKDKIYLKKMKHLIKKVYILGNKKYIKSNNVFKNVIKYPYYLIIRNTSLNKLLKKIDKLAQKYEFNNEEWFECICWSNAQLTYKKAWLGDKEKELFKEFNGELFRVPMEYDKLLKKIYGDYMKLPPEEERIAHHFYKVYKK